MWERLDTHDGSLTWLVRKLVLKTTTFHFSFFVSYSLECLEAIWFSIAESRLWSLSISTLTFYLSI
jgi:hypothetical protein